MPIARVFHRIHRTVYAVHNFEPPSILSTVITRGNGWRICRGRLTRLERRPLPPIVSERRLLFVLQHRSELSASGAANSHREHAIVARPGPFPVGSRGSLEQHAVQQRKSRRLIFSPPFLSHKRPNYFSQFLEISLSSP